MMILWNGEIIQKNKNGSQRNKDKSCFDLLDEDRIFQYKDLCCYNRDDDSVNIIRK